LLLFTEYKVETVRANVDLIDRVSLCLYTRWPWTA